MKKGLILEGGAMRGMFTAGVIDVLMENHIEIDGVIGVSAGATFGCNYKSQQPGRAIRYNKRFSHDKRYCSLKSFIKTGDLYGADFCYNILPNKLDVFDLHTYKDNPTKFYVVASDCETGLPVYKQLYTCNANELNWMRASASMPLVSQIVEVEDVSGDAVTGFSYSKKDSNKNSLYKLLDGGMTDSIPLNYFEHLGYEKNIVVLTQERAYVKKPNKLIWLMKIFLRKYPKIVEAMSKRHEMYNREREEIFEKADRGEILVLCPKVPLGISRTEHNPSKLQYCYDQGRLIAKNHLQEIISYLAK